MTGRTILHIDFDSFFASVEQQYHPEFRGKPLGVTAANGRTCIIAASREAKKAGVKSPSRVYEAERICPGFLTTKADFVKYFTVSKQFLSICKDYSPFVELFSIDELFMDVTKTAHLFGGVETIVHAIKSRIRHEIGEYITASFGIAPNKMLAKMASGLQKPNGMVTITKECIDAIYSKAPLTAICGIGPRIELRLHKLGIYTLLDLRQIPLHRLVKEFGTVEGNFLRDIGYGIDTRPVVPYTQKPTVKSVSRNYCLPKNEYNQRVVLQNVYELSEEIAIKLRRLAKKAKTVGLSLRGTRSMYGRKTAGSYINTGADIFSLCKQLYHEWQWENTWDTRQSMVRQISVWTGNLIEAAAVPLPLFTTDRRRDSLWKTIDTLNDKYGDHTIRNGFLLYADKLTTVPNGWLGDRYERVKLAQSH